MPRKHKVINLEGKRFGKWIVLSYEDKSRWNCRCDCGTSKSIHGTTLRGGTSTNCGCVRRTHGMDGSKIHRLWSYMKERCNSENHKSYEDYGGRGITYHEEWEGFIPFMEWATANGYEEGLTLDRIDVNGNYEPSNCRFITNLEQQRNKRTSRYVTINDETKTVSAWAEQCGVSRQTIRARLERGEEGETLLRPGRIAVREG